MTSVMPKYWLILGIKEKFQLDIRTHTLHGEATEILLVKSLRPVCLLFYYFLRGNLYNRILKTRTRNMGYKEIELSFLANNMVDYLKEPK